MFDMTSILLGAAASGLGLCLTMLALWSTDRTSHFKINWSIGVAFFMAHVFAYWYFAHGGSFASGVLACALQPMAAIFLFASARQFFNEGFKPLTLILSLSVPYLMVAPVLFAFGYDGVALIVQNAMTGTLLVLCGVEYLRRWREAPLSIGGLAALYFIAGSSFFPCGVLILTTSQWSIGYPPENWAEELNAFVSVLALSAAGALTLSVDLTRTAKRNQLSAMVDPLSGLLNRRGFSAAHSRPLYKNEALVVFDLDNFKQVNDRYGHAAGDKAIRAFADTMRAHGRSNDPRTRLGGEEFAMILSRVTPPEARSIAERILSVFGTIDIVSDAGETFRCTASAGIAFGDAEGVLVEDVLTRADNALYSAKRSGRNRVESGKLRLVG